MLKKTHIFRTYFLYIKKKITWKKLDSHKIITITINSQYHVFIINIYETKFNSISIFKHGVHISFSQFPELIYE